MVTNSLPLFQLRSVYSPPFEYWLALEVFLTNINIMWQKWHSVISEAKAQKSLQLSPGSSNPQEALRRVARNLSILRSPLKRTRGGAQVDHPCWAQTSSQPCWAIRHVSKAILGPPGQLTLQLNTEWLSWHFTLPKFLTHNRKLLKERKEKKAVFRH